jgi:hypothetical protein
MHTMMSLAMFGALALAPLASAGAQSSSGTANAPPPASSAPRIDDPDQRVRCRSIQATGSLVRRERVCRTVADWRRISERGNDRARDVVGTGTICSGGDCGRGN